MEKINIEKKKQIENCASHTWTDNEPELILKLRLLLITSFHKSNAVTWNSQVSKNADDHKRLLPSKSEL